MLISLPGIFIHENVKGFPADEMSRLLGWFWSYGVLRVSEDITLMYFNNLTGDEYTVETMLLSPTLFGFPVARDRLYSICVHKHYSLHC